MIRIALVDDDAGYRQELVKHLEKYEEEHKEKLQIAVFSDGDEIVEGYKAGYDIILLDIIMNFMDGMTTAEHIRQVDSEVTIIFITNTTQYAMKGYEVEALDYLLKPVSYFALSQRIDRALERIRKKTKKYLTIPVKGGIQKIDTAKITYIEVRDHDLILHTLKTSFLSKGSLTAVEKQLSSASFFRCNKCYLVNLEYVDGINNNEVLVGHDSILVSRSRKKTLMESLNKYMNEVND